MFGLTGIKLYAGAALGLFILGLMGAVAFLWEKHKADVAQLALKDAKVKELADDLSDSAKENAAIRQRMTDLDAQLKVLRESQQKIQQQKDAIQGEIDALRKTLPAPDQSCLDRPLPDGLAQLLRDGPDSPDKNGSPQGAGKPADAVHEVGVGG